MTAAAPEAAGRGMRGLQGKNVLITGGASGIGQAIAVRFAGYGANIALNYLRTLADAKETEEKVHACLASVQQTGVRDVLVGGDVSEFNRGRVPEGRVVPTQSSEASTAKEPIVSISPERQPLDHRAVNHDLAVFTTHPIVGSGLPLWLPAGAVIRHELELFAAEIARHDGCMAVYSPVLAKLSLFETSGHWATVSLGSGPWGSPRAAMAKRTMDGRLVVDLIDPQASASRR